MNARISALTCLSLAALVSGGCGENPAENVAPAVTAAPKPVDSAPAPAPAPAATTTAPAAAAAPTALAAGGQLPAAAAAAAPAGALAISGDSGSKIEFVGSKKVGGSHNGGFKTWTGTIELNAEKTAVSKVAVDIDAKSIWSDDEKLTGHLKNQDFFEVDKHPKSTFVTTEIKPGGEKGATHTLVGNLTLHGVTKSITIPATVKVADGAASIVSEFSFKRSDFGMTYTRGGLVRDEVVVKLDVKTAKKG